MGAAELGVAIGVAALLVGGTIGIAVLCWVWMKKSRASQSRMEAANREIIDLLREQNRILLDLLGRSRPGD